MINRTCSYIFSSQFFLTVFALGFLVVPLSGCDFAKNQLKPDRSASMEVQDFKDGLAPRLPEVDENESGYNVSIPELKPYVAQGGAIGKSMPLVSISVNQSVPLRDILFELANQADYDLELDPRISGSIIFTARNRPLDEVVERISDMAGLRHNFDNDVLRVEIDTPYNKSYKIDYLSFIRSNSGSVRNDVAVVAGEGADTGSSFEATSESEADFWGELETNLTQILEASSSSLKTSVTPRITAMDQNPDVRPVAPQGRGGQVQISPPDAVLRVESLPISGDDVGAQGAAGAAVSATFSLNKMAGIVNVFAPQRQQKEIEKYLTLLRRSATAQVLIEAKILEVSLSDQYATGINWREINPTGDLTTLNFLSNTGGAFLDALNANSTTAIAGASSFGVGYAGSNIEAFIEALSTFGTVRALASPRMTVLNNQSAVLNVATNVVFFEVEVKSDSTPVAGAGATVNTKVTSEIRNVPVGVLVNVMPSIDLERQTISLAVRPTVTSIDAQVEDPGVAFVIAQCGAPCANLAPSLIPQLDVQEIDTVIKVSSGQAVVMGGLLNDRSETSEDGVPILSEIPMFGSLFKNHSDTVTKTELVIFLKATILNSPSGSVHSADKDLYRRFSSDRRPFKL